MKKSFFLKSPILRILFFQAIIISVLTSCGGNKTSEATEDKKVDDEAFYQSQPFRSGLYDASYFEIKKEAEGKTDIVNKGHYDGRIFFALSPETSAMYVFENGNRTKINYVVNFQKPFEKTDSGTFVTMDAKNLPVVITPDTADYLLNFQRSGEDITITFSPKPRYTGSAFEIMEKMAEQKNKK